MNSEELFGWDLLYKTTESSVTRESDVLIVLAHFVLIKAKLRCIGIGEDKTFSKDEESTELLPEGWSDSPDKYALRYVFDSKLYLLLATKSDSIFILNLLDVETKDVSNIGLDPKDLVKALKGPLKTLIPTASTIIDRFRKELLYTIIYSKSKAATTQTTEVEPKKEKRDTRNDYYDPLRVSGPQRAPGFRPLFGIGIGQGDLDPLGGGGLGNLAVFPRIGPQGGGARFDPFGPGGGIGRNPNNDEFRPPGFGDYFM